MGAQGLTWEIAGVYEAPSLDRACIYAMQETGHGTAFAVPGYAFGVDTVNASGVREFGRPRDAASRLDDLEERIADSLEALTSAASPPELPAETDSTRRHRRRH